MITNEEAIKYLIKPFATSTKSYNEYLKQKEAYEIAIKSLEERPQGECRTCRYRDPEDKKCDCGGLERQGCYFCVSDDYYCKYYERGT